MTYFQNVYEAIPESIEQLRNKLKERNESFIFDVELIQSRNPVEAGFQLRCVELLSDIRWNAVTHHVEGFEGECQKVGYNNINNSAKTAAKRLVEAIHIEKLMRMPEDYSDMVGRIYKQTGHRLAVNMRKGQMIARTEIIELAGANRGTNRLDLVLTEEGEQFIVGKVRVPYLEPTDGTRFRCLVLEDEMSPGAMERLEYKYQTRERATFTVGKLHFSGVITSLVQGPGAGCFDGINIPKQVVVMFDVGPGFVAPTPNQCASCKRSLYGGEGINTPTRGTLCAKCFQ